MLPWRLSAQTSRRTPCAELYPRIVEEPGAGQGLPRQQMRDLGGALLWSPRKAPLDGHARHQLVLNDTVGLLLGFPYRGDENAAVCRPGGVVDLSLGQAARRVHDGHSRVVLILRGARPEMRDQICHWWSLRWFGGAYSI